MNQICKILLGFSLLFSALSHAAPPANDNFADAITLIGESGSVMTSNIDATSEPGEPQMGGNTNNSIWYSWQAPNDGYYIFELTNHDYNASIYTLSGTTLNSLNIITESSSLVGISAPMALYATAGQNYFISVNGRNTETGTATLVFSRVSDLLVKNVSYNGFSTEFTSMINANGTLLFGTDSASPELWKSDGTVAGTVQLKKFGCVPGSTTCGFGLIWVQLYVNFKGKTFFRVWDEPYGVELWQTDGTAAGTELFKDIIPGPASSTPGGLTKVNGNLFFTAHDGINGIELWKTDGTESGTQIVKDIYPGGGSSRPIWLTNVNGTLYFKALHPDYGKELWKSDGTEAGTVLVKDLLPGPTGDSRLGALTKVNDLLFFTADVNPGFKRDLWKSDGTDAGTVIVKDIRPGGDPNVLNLENVNGTLYFTAHDQTNSNELWKSDGTEMGTVLVKDINPGPTPSSPRGLKNINGTLYFTTSLDTVNGPELWKSDGTEMGTVLVKDINPGSDGSSPFPFVNVNGVLYFSADNGLNGRELWKSDGTESGTVLLEDISEGIQGSSPGYMVPVNGQLFFTATGELGTELYKDPEVISNFADVPPGSFGFQFIEDFFGAQITGGCALDNYCPNSSVTREQMAVFLEKASRGAAFMPPAATGVFTDVDITSGFAPWIEQLFADGITGGCGVNTYCPDDTVTRGQMAVFIEKALRGSGFVPPAATGIFIDVPVTLGFAPWIEQLARDNITGGCGANIYCPNNPVTRAQMAVFMVKAFDL